MFSDNERELLAEAGFMLGPTSADQALQERYLGYIAFTRAAEYLWISYPLASEDGRALAPSSFVAKLKAVFPQLKPETVGNEPDGSVAEALPWLTSQRRLVAAAVRRMQVGADLDHQLEWQAVVRFAGVDNDARHISASLQHSHVEPPFAS
jgi:ATP-dependent helicase/nuclease subunit B